MARKKSPKMGRPPRHEGERLSKNRTFRIRGELDDRLQAAASKAGRSVSEEIEYRLEHSFRREDTTGLVKKTVREAVDYMIHLTEIGLWTPEYARKRWKGGHPAVPAFVDALIDLSNEAGVTPEEFFKNLLREKGVDPDAPDVPPDK